MFIFQNRGRKPRKKDQLKLFLTNLHLTRCERINTIYFLLYSLKDPSPKPNFLETEPTLLYQLTLPKG